MFLLTFYRRWKYRRTHNVTFYIKVNMQKRWVPHFLAMLHEMEVLGGQGSSRYVTLFADGDGDFRPHFKFKDIKYKNKGYKDVKPHVSDRGDTYFDAG
jgi:hypothetical protein